LVVPKLVVPYLRATGITPPEYIDMVLSSNWLMGTYMVKG